MVKCGGPRSPSGTKRRTGGVFEKSDGISALCVSPSPLPPRAAAARNWCCCCWYCSSSIAAPKFALRVDPSDKLRIRYGQSVAHM